MLEQLPHMLIIIITLLLFVQMRVNDICRSKGISFFSGQAMGLSAYIFADLQQFSYEMFVLSLLTHNTIDRLDKNKQTIEKTQQFMSLSTIHETVDWRKIKNLSKLWLAFQGMLKKMSSCVLCCDLFISQQHVVIICNPRETSGTQIVEQKNALLKQKHMDPALVPDSLIS